MPLVTFRLSSHPDYRDEDTIELRCRGEVIATLYGRLRSGPDAPTTTGIRIVSKHLCNDPEHLVLDVDKPPALMIKFD